MMAYINDLFLFVLIIVNVVVMVAIVAYLTFMLRSLLVDGKMNHNAIRHFISVLTFTKSPTKISEKEMLNLFVNWETIEQLNMYVREGFHPDIAEQALKIRTMKRVIT